MHRHISAVRCGFGVADAPATLPTLDEVMHLVEQAEGTRHVANVLALRERFAAGGYPA